MPDRGRPDAVRIRLATIGTEAQSPTSCPACGRGQFTVHAHGSRRVADFPPRRVQVVAYRCRRCQHVHRRYPEGVDAYGRSVAVSQVIKVLRCLGFTYRAIAAQLESIDLHVAAATVRTVAASTPPGIGRAPPRGGLAAEFDRVHLTLEEDADARWLVLAAPEGAALGALLQAAQRCTETVTNDS